MAKYQEKVLLLNRPSQAYALATGVLGFLALGYMAWTFLLRDESLSAAWMWWTMLGMYFPFHVMLFGQTLHSGCYPHAELELGEDTLRMKRGLVVRSIALADIVAAEALTSQRVKRTFHDTGFPFNFKSLFVNTSGLPHVRIVQTGGATLLVATPSAEKLASLLISSAEAARRRGVLGILPDSSN